MTEDDVATPVPGSRRSRRSKRSKRRKRIRLFVRVLVTSFGLIAFAIALLAAGLYRPVTSLQDAQKHLKLAQHSAWGLTGASSTHALTALRKDLVAAQLSLGGDSAGIERSWQARLLTHVPGVGDQIKALRTLRAIGTCGVDLAQRTLPVASAAVEVGAKIGPLERALQALAVDPSLVPEARKDLDCANGGLAHLHSVDLWWPLADKVAGLQKLGREALPPAGVALDACEGLVRALGSGHHRYLLTLDNPAEQRPGGGFIGVVGTLDSTNGKITTAFRDGNFQPSHYTTRRAPRPLDQHLFVGRPWDLADTNWSADFPTSAQTAAEFWKGETGQDVEGVVSLSTPVIAELLKVTGTVRVPPYPQVITPANALLELNEIANKIRPGDPGKDYVVGFGKAVVAKLMALKPKQLEPAGKIVGTAAQERNISLWFKDSRLQQLTQKHDLDRALVAPGTHDDVAAVTDANIGGGKNDLFVLRNLALVVDRRKPTEIGHHLTLSYVQPAPKNVFEQRLQPGSGGAYRDYIEVRLPASAHLVGMSQSLDRKISPTGPESIDTDHGFVRVAYFLILSPGHRADITFDYTTSADLTSLTIMKQQQALPHPATITIIPAKGPRRTTREVLDQDLHHGF